MQLVSGRRTARSSGVVRRVATVVSAGVVLVLTSRASARPAYPGYLQRAVDMPCTPSCMLCHTDPAGGAERLNSKYLGFYAVALAQRAAEESGMEGSDPSVLLANSDQDEDGKSDLDELRAGESPIMHGPAPVCVPEYGCGVRAAPTQADSSAPKGWLIGTLALAALARLQLRRRVQPR